MIDRETVELAERHAKDLAAFDAHRKASVDFEERRRARMLEDERAIADQNERRQVLGAALKRSREALRVLEAEIATEVKAVENTKTAELAAGRELEELQRRAAGARAVAMQRRKTGADARTVTAAEASEKELLKLVDAGKAKLAAAGDAVKRADKTRAAALERVKKSVPSPAKP